MTGPSPDDDVDILLIDDPTVDPRGSPAAIRVGLVRDVDEWLAATWFDDLDIALAVGSAADRLASARRAPLTFPVAGDGADLVDVLATSLDAWSAATRIGIRIGLPSWDVAASWGDVHCARDLQRWLARAGHPSRIHIRPDWARAWSARDDVTIHLLGQHDGPTRPGQVNVLWHISHPDNGSAALYDRFDLVCVASDDFARWMARQAQVPVRALHQATDPERFHPDQPGPAHELLFVANSRGVRRHLIDELLPTEHQLAVFGRGWTPDRLDPRYLVAEIIPNDLLGGYYAHAAIVLNDHWSDMQRESFLSNRLYDASAAGGFVISDDIAGLDVEFDGGIVAYRDATDLRRLIEHYLASPAERRAHADRARAAVLDRHTFERRTHELLDLVEPLLDARSARPVSELRGGPIHDTRRAGEGERG